MEAQFKATISNVQAVLKASGLQKVNVHSDGANSPIFTFTGKSGQYVEVDAASFGEVYAAVRQFTGVRQEADKWALTIDRLGGLFTGSMNNRALRLYV